MGHADSNAHHGQHGHGHGHGHHHDRGPGAALRYLKLLPRLWHSEVNDAVVADVDPKPGERVVDLGAGAGAASVVAARRGASVIAVDPTPFMRTLLRLRRLRHGNALTVSDGAAEKIPARDASVDALWTVNTLHHWTDPGAAVRELARVLKPGGRVLLVDEDMGNPAHPEHAQWEQKRKQWALHFEEVDPAALANQLSAAGFSRAEGRLDSFAGRPVRIVRATR